MAMCSDIMNWALQGPHTSLAQSEELRVSAARLLAAQGMVREGYMAGAARHGPVSGWPSPSSTDGPSAVPTSSKKAGLHCLSLLLLHSVSHSTHVWSCLTMSCKR